MESTVIQAKRRTEIGTRAARRDREAGLIPGIIYGHGETPETVSLPKRELLVELGHGSRVLELDIEGTKAPYLIKVIQYDYLDTNPIHIDLMRVDADERVKVTVGLELRGEPRGLSEGGILDQRLASIEIECLVGQIPETLHPSVSQLGLGESLTIGDLELPDGVVALLAADERIATLRAPAVETDADEDAEDSAEGSAQPELIGRSKEEESEADSKS